MSSHIIPRRWVDAALSFAGVRRSAPQEKKELGPMDLGSPDRVFVTLREAIEHRDAVRFQAVHDPQSDVAGIRAIATEPDVAAKYMETARADMASWPNTRHTEVATLDDGRKVFRSHLEGNPPNADILFIVRKDGAQWRLNNFRSAAEEPPQPIQIGPLTIANPSDETRRVLGGRQAFVAEYCREKGWNPDNLTIPQIMQIRSQDGWKSPTSAA